LKRSDKDELVILRISLARVAQAAGVQTADKPVLDRFSFNELGEMAEQDDRGWNALAAAVCDEIQKEREHGQHYS